MAKGYVYILVNAAMPGLVKIGRTSRTIEERVAELSSATGVPGRFVAAYWESVSDADAAEAEVHACLFDKKHSDNREFFKISPPEAVEIVRVVAARYGVTQTSGSTSNRLAPEAGNNLYLISHGDGLARLGMTSMSEDELVTKMSDINGGYLYDQHKLHYFEADKKNGHSIVREFNKTFDRIDESSGTAFRRVGTIENALNLLHGLLARQRKLDAFEDFQERQRKPPSSPLKKNWDGF